MNELVTNSVTKDTPFWHAIFLVFISVYFINLILINLPIRHMKGPLKTCTPDVSTVDLYCFGKNKTGNSIQELTHYVTAIDG